MVRFKAKQAPILNSDDQSKRGEIVTRGLKRLMVKGINTDGVVCTAVIVKRGELSWTSFGFYKETTSQSSVNELPNLPFRSYDSRDRLSIAYAFSCACSDLITSKMKRKVCKSEGDRIDVFPTGNVAAPVLRNHEDILQAYLLDSKHQGNFYFHLPVHSSRLNIMLPHSLVQVGHGPTTINDLMKQFIMPVRERALDLVKTQYAEKVGVLVAFQGNDLQVFWRLCSLEKDGADCMFGSLCGEYIDASNTMIMKNTRLYRLLPVAQALKGHIASVQESTMASSTSSMSSAASLSSGFMKPLSACNSSTDSKANIEKPKGVLAVLTSLLKSAMDKVFRNSKLTQEWADFRKHVKNNNKEIEGDVEMTSCSLATKMHDVIDKTDGSVSSERKLRQECTDMEVSKSLNGPICKSTQRKESKKRKSTKDSSENDSAVISNTVANNESTISTRIVRVCKPKQYYS